MEDRRKEKGFEIAKKDDQIKRLNDEYYKVKSQSSNRIYDVVHTDMGWVCSCPDNTFRRTCCKHIHAVEFSIEFRKEVQQTIIKPLSNQNCPSCNSQDIIKRGIRKNKAGTLQRFYCNDCSKWFVFNLGFEKMRASPQVITNALQLYFSGESLRNVHHFLKLQGVEVSHMAVYRWIKKYVSLMEKYLDNITPQVSDSWRSDELYFKAKGNPKYLYALMDDETRFWIASQVSNKKYTDNISPLFQKGREIAGKKPKVLITDGARNFAEAWKKEYKKKNPLDTDTEHIRHIHWWNDFNNNKMERLNGEIRAREKPARGLKKEDSALLEGYRIYHNFVRPHMGLNGQTPADLAKIKVEGENKWVTLIQNAKKSQIVTGGTTCQ